MAVNYFYSLTPRQFANLTIGYNKKQQEATKQSWEQTRMIMHTVLLPYQQKGKTLKVTDVLPFPWEKEIQQEDQKPKTRAELEAYWQEIDNQKNKPKK
ncbi:hypothetical protein [Tenacibaculum soleae]|uniref:hypothetical protein n=1 Tax=Tenacibaculum soleae TaxID=447689 RepID=UPI00159F27DE|nr:hypothetical protein [Tenacibaculum soleae]